LDFQAEKIDMLDEKMHRERPLLVQGTFFRTKNILFLYVIPSLDHSEACDLCSLGKRGKETLQRLLAGDFGCISRVETRVPQLHSHRLPFAP
jgi:hypothetical protein